MPFVSCAFRFLVAAILSGSRIFGGYAPFCVAFAAACGAGAEGLSALLGVLVGTLLFMPLADAMKYIAIAVLAFSASLAFCDTRFCRSPRFLPLNALCCTAAVSFVYLSSSGIFSVQGANFLLELFLVSGCSICYRIALQSSLPPDTRESLLSCALLAITLLIALSVIPLGEYFSLGRIFSVVIVMLVGRLGGLGLGCVTGLCTGLAMDSITGIPCFSLSYSISAVCAGLFPCRRASYALLFLSGTLLSLFWSHGELAIYGLLETAIAGILFLFLPQKYFQVPRKATEEAPEESLPRTLERQLRGTASIFRELYNSLSRSDAALQNTENIALVFDRAADRICRSCPKCGSCWEQNYVTTYTVLNDMTAAMTRRGRALTSDFPAYFSKECVRFQEFVAAINAEFSALLLRRQYTNQLQTTRQAAKEQYARLSELLSTSADRLRAAPIAVAAMASATPSFEVRTFTRPKAGERVSGDTLAHFTIENGDVCLILSDGMGCGEAARRESAMAVRLLEQFLKAGIEPATALKTLNTALTLHTDEAGAFTTVDLLMYQPRNGSASFYKYGAAPSYLLHGGQIRRITGGALPAGLGDIAQPPDAASCSLAAGDLVLMVSDGFCDGQEDGWLEALLAAQGSAPLSSLSALLSASCPDLATGGDDASFLLLRVLPQERAIV